MITKEQEILKDESKAGRYLPWKEKKLANVHYYELLHILQFKKASRVKVCADVLEFKQDRKTGERTLYNAWFCKSRLCALCNWRRTMKHGIQSEKVIREVMNRVPTARWLFLTLSVKNVYDGDELDQSFKDLSEGFNRLVKYKKVAKNLIGFMRASEVTVNDVDGSYNQHIHVLACVKPTYFKDSTNYISQSELTKLWRKAMKLEYDPIVHISVVKPKNKYQDDIRGAINEVAKYPVKDTDYLTENEQKNLKRVKDLEKGLQYKRLLGYGGLLREIHRELNLDDAEDGNLINVDDEEKIKDDEAYSVFAQWNWQRKNYYIR